MSSQSYNRMVDASGRAMGFGTWCALDLGGALLFTFFLAHLWAVHTAAEAGALTFRGVADRVRSPLFGFLDLGLLILVAYHGLAGLRRVIVDAWSIGPRGQRYLLWGAVVLGAFMVLVGVQVILRLAGGAG